MTPFVPSKTALIVDSPMGAGKSTWAKRAMIGADHAYGSALFGDKPLPKPRFIYIAPLLELATDVARECHELEFAEPTQNGGSKMRDLKALLRDGRNIATTHALFENLDADALHLIERAGYFLVVDEQLETAQQFRISRKDLEHLEGSGLMAVDETTRRLVWLDGSYRGRWSDVKNLCDLGALTKWEDSVIMWELPSSILPVFERIVVLTYLFRGSMMDAHLRANGIGYEVAAVRVDAEGNYKLVPESERNDRVLRARFKALLSVVDDEKLNAIGTPPVGRESRSQPLSATWFKRGKGSNTETLRKNLDTFLRSRCSSSSGQAMWTSFVAQRAALAPQGFAKSFVPFNARGTNAHRKREHVAYLCNTFAHPSIVRYLEWRGVSIDGDLYALSALIQWLWRGRIRDGKPMVAYIPSERMRSLLRDWLNGKDLAPHRDMVEAISRSLAVPPQSNEQFNEDTIPDDGVPFERFDDFEAHGYNDESDSTSDEQSDSTSDEQSDSTSDEEETIEA